MYYIIYATMFVVIFKNIISETNTNISSSSNNTIINRSLQPLSRKKRFLVFPDGSSVQLVFCNQYHGYLKIGDIVWFGTTAALAWELPTDPEVYDMFRDQNKIYEATRRTDVIYYLDEDGKVVGRKDYKRKSAIINPAFAKRSIDQKEYVKVKPKISVKEMHKKQKDKIIWTNTDATKIEYLRKEKQKLYRKFKYFLQSLGWSGDDRIQKMLCWARTANEQGTFLEEIFKAIFTLPKVHGNTEFHNQYDDAQGANEDCTDIYPQCGHV